MSDWDEVNGALADLLGEANLINEAVPGFLPRTIYARSGSHWSMLSVRDVAGTNVVICVAGILVDVPVTSTVMASLAAQSASNAVGSYLPIIPAGEDMCAIAFKATVAPYESLWSPGSAARPYMQKAISATLGCGGELQADFKQRFGGIPWEFDHHPYFVNF